MLFSKVKSSPIVYQLLENELLNEQNGNDNSSPAKTTDESNKIKVINSK